MMTNSLGGIRKKVLDVVLWLKARLGSFSEAPIIVGAFTVRVT